MQIWAESGKSALPICNYSQILYQFLTFTQNLKRSRFFLSAACSKQQAVYLLPVHLRMITCIFVFCDNAVDFLKVGRYHITDDTVLDGCHGIAVF